MKKILLLLDEVTIINFKFIAHIAMRYRMLLSVFIASFLLLVFYQYVNQPMIHTSIVNFQTSTKHSVSEDLSSLLPVVNGQQVSTSELEAISHSYNFLQNISEVLIENPLFDQINFGSLLTGKNFTGKMIGNECHGDKKCMIEKMSPAISLMFKVEEGRLPGSYILACNALDAVTAKTLSSIIATQIDQSRITNRKKLIEKELESVNKLVDEIKTSFKNANGFTLIENNEKIQNSITEYKDRIRNMQDEINKEKATLASYEVKVNQNKQLFMKDDNSEEQLTKEKFLKISNRINDIRFNLANLTSIAESQRTVSDNTIIDQLKKELLELEKRIPQQTDLKTIAFNDEFIETQRKREHNFEFDRVVLNKKVEKLEQSLRMAKLELDALLQAKVNGESKLYTLKADLDFLKNIEAKQISLKLILSTVTSDLHFEEIDPRTSSYRRSSLVKIFLFSALLSIFIYLITLISYFVFDDKIYNTDDLALIIDKTMIIGEVPHFDFKKRIKASVKG